MAPQRTSTRSSQLPDPVTAGPADVGRTGELGSEGGSQAQLGQTLGGNVDPYAPPRRLRHAWFWLLLGAAGIFSALWYLARMFVL